MSLNACSWLQTTLGYDVDERGLLRVWSSTFCSHHWILFHNICGGRYRGRETRGDEEELEHET